MQVFPEYRTAVEAFPYTKGHATLECDGNVDQQLNVNVDQQLNGNVDQQLHVELGSVYEGLEDVVSSTSRSFAAYRAIESARPDALFRDPLAEYLAGEVAIGKQRAQIAAGGNPGARFAVRTKYFDNALVAAIDRIKSAVPNAKVQVVLFGCGMDARAWRLPEASTSDTQPEDVPPPAEITFEGDRPDVIRLKRQLLRELEVAGKLPPLRLSRRHAILPIDLNEATWQRLLVQDGFQTSEPTVWLFEGLVMYLQPAAVVSLLEATSKLSAPGSVLLVSGISELTVQRGKQSVSPVRRSWTWGSNEPEAFFNAHGWHVLKVDDVTGGMFGRVLPTTPGRERNMTWYLTAVKI